MHFSHVSKIKKPIILTFLLSCCLFIQISCTGSPGQPYLKYYWIGTPLAFSDSNPSTPYTVYNNVYFPTDTGTFYMQYIAWDGSGWWMYYSITSNPGKMFWVPGDDSWFEIDLFSSGPSIYEWPLEMSVEEAHYSTSGDISSAIVINHEVVVPDVLQEPEPLYVQSITKGNYTLEIRCGRS